MAAWFAGGTDDPGPVVETPAPDRVDEPLAAPQVGGDAIGEPAVGRTPVPSTVPDSAGLLGGRLLGPDGSPLADAGAEFRIRMAAGVLDEGRLATDPDGRFELPFELAGRNPPFSLEVRDRDEHGPCGVAVALPELRAGQRTELGDLRLLGLPRVAWGRVIDDAGRGVAGARVALLRRRPPEAAGRIVFGSNLSTSTQLNGRTVLTLSPAVEGQQVKLRLELADARQMLVAQRSAEDERRAAEARLEQALAQYARLQLLQTQNQLTASHVLAVSGHHDEALVETRSRDDGSFELFSLPIEGSLLVRASKDGHRTATSGELASGASVDLTLARTAAPAGAAAIPDWLPARALGFELVARESDGRKHTADVVGDRGEARFSFHDVLAGAYDFSVRVRGFPAPILRVEEIVVQPGQREPDPRLVGLDLTRALFRYELRAVDDAGAVLHEIPSPLLARVQQPDGKLRHIGFPWRDGRAEIFSASPRLDITLLCVGYRLRELTVPHGKNDVVFQRLHPVEILLPDARRLCGEGRKVRVSLVMTTASGLPGALQALDQRSGKSQSYSRWHLAKSGGAWLGDTDLVQVPLIKSGTYEVILRLHEEGVGGDASRTVGSVDVILDGARPQRLVVPVDPAVIETALAELRSRKSR